MTDSSSIKSVTIALGIHVVAFVALVVWGTTSGSSDVVSSDSDPILLMISGTDPTKSAGIVDRERGVARGTKEGKIFDPGKYTPERLDAITKENEASAKAAEAAQKAAESAKNVPETPAPPKKPAPKNTTGTQSPAPGKTASNDGKPERVSLADALKDRNRNKGGKGKSGTKSGSGKTGTGKTGTGKTVSGVKINTSDIFGTATGTGENGGEGGSAVATRDARAEYVEAIALVFFNHLENVLAQNPVSIPQSVTVAVQFAIDKRGNIRFLKIENNFDPQVRDRVQKAFARIPRQSAPPRGEPFTGRIAHVTIRVD